MPMPHPEEQITGDIQQRIVSVFNNTAQQLLTLRSQIPPIASVNSDSVLQQMWNALQANPDIDEIWAADDSEPGSYTIVDIDQTDGRRSSRWCC